MGNINFEWDENKNIINIQKHKISFEEAKTVFYDENGIIISDEEHSENEDRFILLGMSQKANILVVCHCIRYGDTIRIISSRKATKQETNQYYEFL